ncbi:hypothetical protein DMB92_03245 [Campylobacter sp. MIT 99-7217]|uniref:glycosyltransferase family 8 protein n=1 Tax=Campylobacter sp. MIT 99-7217 TaxID=535091 RepID=UPI001159DA1D|nr:glycosyltransferase [Campylobacter sp. MIT 99-7217]TQR32992.1 hypothetical protein DMB92_03245 [Campylobacter sp. MIT 99-7217]
MFHIFFCANEAYVKFAAVMIYNIITKTKTTLKFKDFFDSQNISKELLPFQKDISYIHSSCDEAYIFHILSDKISSQSKEKLEKLCENLNNIYPCRLEIHFLNDKKYQDSFAYKGNFIANFILDFVDFLPNEAQKALALDLDMYVNTDLRELFTLNLQDYIVAVASNYTQKSKWFNTGFVLFNAKLYQKFHIQEKALEYIKTYKPELPDQAALNICCKEKALFLPLNFNLYPHAENEKYGNFVDENEQAFMNMSRKEFEALKQNAKIVHFLGCSKPWNSVFESKEIKITNFRTLWWKNAFQTPFFKDELKELAFFMQEKEFNTLYLRLNERIEKSFENNPNLKREKTGAVFIFKNSLEYKIGEEMMSIRQGFISYLKFYFKARKIIKDHKNYEKFYKAMCRINPELYLTRLQDYADYENALALKRHLTYRLGEAFMQAHKKPLKYLWLLRRIKELKKEF